MIRNKKNIYQLKKMGFKNIGRNCFIAKNVRAYNGTITIGNNVRVDDDVVLKGKIQIGNNVHIARGCTLSGGTKGIYIDDFAVFSNYCQLFTTSDNYLASALPSGTLKKDLQKKFCSLYEKPIMIGKGALFGTFCTVLPGSNVGDYSSFASYSSVYKKKISGYFYNNQKKIKKNLKEIKKKYKQFLTK